MKFKDTKSLIEEMMIHYSNNQILLSMNSKEFDSLVKRGDKKGDGMGMEIISNSFTPFFDDSIIHYNKKNEDDFILINKKGWEKFISLIS